MKNANLNKAKKEKNDEFYTRLTDVEKELRYYKKHFKDKVVLCNCDDPTWSAFWQYFHLNFTELGLKKLISTHYDAEKAAYKMEYSGGNDSDLTTDTIIPLEGNGDFRNKECLDILDGADIVVTNPPFSLFREYIATLIEHNKKFLIVGSMNAISYKEIFPLFEDNKVWLGYNLIKQFDQPNGEIKKFGNVQWYTNMDIDRRHETITLWRTYDKNYYRVYDNCDAIDVNKLTDIPLDYNGIIGVPISFFKWHNPDQFEIVGFRKGSDGKDLMIDNHVVFTRVLIRNKTL